ncbi:hypothetical protein [Aliivibrio logei]|uniref:hypothetical protein n=1 Tax=Aliivibrio logei TaxID=688 RepID=UPI0035C8B311
MDKKSKMLQSYFFEQKERSKRYITLSAVGIFLLLSSIYWLPGLLALTSDALDFMYYFTFVLSTALTVYWYLQIKPSQYLYNEIVPVSKPLNRTERLTRINEIFEAMQIYEKYNKYPNLEGNHDLSELDSFILRRRDVFPSNHEFGARSELGLNLSSEISRTLFITALNSLKNELISEEEKINNQQELGQHQDNDQNKSDIDSISLVNTFTNRLKNEIEQLTKAASIYITFGSAITVGAALILYFTITDLSSYFTDPYTGEKAILTSSDWFSIVSRFSIVVFVEVFAFYYLRLYRSMMDTVKYYQNEITNIELRLMAVHSLNSLTLPDSSSANALITSLANSERNFVIQKGQTTVDLEKQKIDSNQINSIFEGITKLTKVFQR